MAQLNISQDNVSGECNLKCSYSFQYSNSSCVASNTGESIVLSYDESNVPPVTYNGNKYKVSSIKITTGSILLYNGKNIKASLIISHAPIVGGGPFSVIIPIVSGTGSLPSSNILTTIITETAKIAPKSGNKTSISLANYNLNNIVPKKPFYSFNTDRENFIAYGLENAITIDADTLTKLSTITKGVADIIPATSSLFYNPKGPNSNGSSSGNDDIYIDCQPVNVSEEAIQMSTENKLSADYQLKSDYNARNTLITIFFNPWFQLLLLIFAIVLFYYFIQFVLKLGDVKVVK